MKLHANCEIVAGSCCHGLTRLLTIMRSIHSLLVPLWELVFKKRRSTSKAGLNQIRTIQHPDDSVMRHNSIPNYAHRTYLAKIRAHRAWHVRCRHHVFEIRSLQHTQGHVRPKRRMTDVHGAVCPYYYNNLGITQYARTPHSADENVVNAKRPYFEGHNLNV